MLHNRDILSLAFSPDNTAVLTGGQDSKVNYLRLPFRSLKTAVAKTIPLTADERRKKPARSVSERNVALEGSFFLKNKRLRLRFDLHKGSGGAWSGRVTSLDEGNTTSKLTKLVNQNGTLKMVFDNIGAEFEGSNTQAGSYEGTWTQNNVPYPMKISQVKDQQ